jgi:hypothetical protein
MINTNLPETLYPDKARDARIKFLEEHGLTEEKLLESENNEAHPHEAIKCARFRRGRNK